METYEEKIKRLSEAWELFASIIEDEITANWVDREPTKLMRDISTYLSAHDSVKADRFDKRFFKLLD